MRRFSVYFLVSLALHAMASLFLRESVVEAGRAQDLAKQPDAMLIQLAPAPAVMTQTVAVAPAKPVAKPVAEERVAQPVIAPEPPLAKPVMVARKAEPRPFANTTPPKEPPRKPPPKEMAQPKPVAPQAAPGPELAKLQLPSAATSAGPVTPEPVREVFSNKPSYLQPPTQPHYPKLAKRRNQQGVVLVEVRLDERGQQRAVQIVRSSGVESLDEAALEAVADWHFRPETLDGRAVPSRVQIPIEFALTASR